MSVTIDPEFRDLIPAPEAEELAGLRESIRVHGCMDPLIVWAGHGVVVDGHNRLAICRELDVPFRTREMDFPSRDAVREFIIRHQLGRRNLSTSQRATLAAEMPAKRRGNPSFGANPPKGGIAASEAADAQGVSQRAVERARKVKAKGVPELHAAVRDGRISVSLAEQCLVFDEDTQRKIADGGRDVGQEEIRRRRDAARKDAIEKERRRKISEAHQRKKLETNTKQVDRPEIDDVMRDAFRDTPQESIRRAWAMLDAAQKVRMLRELMSDSDVAGQVAS